MADPIATETAPALRREMGLRDTTLFAIACIVATRWVPAAAHAGPGSITLWLLAAVFFVAPLAVAVAALIVKYPGAGGMYLWTRGDFGPWHGFLCFWVYWMAMAVWLPSAATFYMGVGFSTLGPSAARLAGDRFFLVGAALAAIWVALGANMAGVKIGKWTENAGAAATWLLGGLLAVAAALVCAKRGLATPMRLMPHWNWETVSFWSTIAYGMSGLEMAGLMGAEIHDPARTLPRAGWLASGFATVFYASITAAMLALLRPEHISEMNGYAEAGGAAAAVLGARWLTPAIALLVLVSGLGQVGALRLHPDAGRGGVVPAGGHAAWRHHARGIPGDGVADGDYGVSALRLYLRQRLEGRETVERGVRLVRHGAGHRLRGGSDRGNQKRLAV
jgi:amino acid transporter